MCLAILVNIIPAPGNTQEEATLQQARIENEQAIALSKEGKCDQAVLHWEKAYRLHAVPVILFNMAKCQEQIANQVNAFELYRQFLQSPPDPRFSESYDEARKQLELLRVELSKMYALITIKVEPTESFVYVDEKNAAHLFTSPVTRWLKFGPHVLFVEQEGYQPREKKFLVSQGEHRTLKIRLVKLESEVTGTVSATKETATKAITSTPASPPDNAEELVIREGEMSTARITAWSTLGVGIALVGAGAVFHGLALSKDSEVDELEPKWGEQLEYEKQRAALIDAAESRMTIAAVMYGVGGAVLVTSFVLFLFEAEEIMDTSQPGISFNALMQPHGASITASYRF